MDGDLPTGEDFFGAQPKPQSADLPSGEDFFGPSLTSRLKTGVANVAQSYVTTAETAVTAPFHLAQQAGAALGINEPPPSGPEYDDFFHKTPFGHVLDHFGQGLKDGWGDGPMTLSEDSEKWLRDVGIYNDYKSGQQSLIKSYNEAFLRPAVTGLTTLGEAGWRGMSAAFAGAQAVLHEGGEAVGQLLPQKGIEGVIGPGSRFAADVAALPEAFPNAHFFGVPTTIAKARALGVIGEGEAGWKGTLPAEDPKVAQRRYVDAYRDWEDERAAAPASAEGTTQGEPMPSAPGEAPQAAPAPDIHQTARQIAPEVMSHYDALQTRQDTFRRWIDEFREERDTKATADLDKQIEDTQSRLEGATGKRAATYRDRLEDLQSQRETALTDARKADSPEMTKIRGELQKVDYQLRDLAPDVSAAYRRAQEVMPEGETVSGQTPAVEGPAAPETRSAEPAPTEQPGAETAPQTPLAGATVAPEAQIPGAEAAPARGEPAPAAPSERPTGVAKPIEEQKAAIIADRMRSLVAAGRPEAEARAAAQLDAARYATRAARFNGAKGTAEELYNAEGAEVRAGRERAGAPVKELVQKGQKELDQEANATTETPEFKAWFGDSKVVDAEGKPLVVYHGTNQNIQQFDQERLGKNTNTVSSKGFFFTEHPGEAGEYADMSARKQVSNAPEAEANSERLLKAIERAQRRGDFDLEEKLTHELEASEEEAMSGEARGANIVPTYLNIKNPMILDMKGSVDLHKISEAIDKAKSEGHDGLRLDNVFDAVADRPEKFDTTQWVAFAPEQIKSVYNRGTFDPNSAKILEQPAYHGSPYKFDQFTTEHIGKGEGAQAYGWGLYFAGEKKVAEYYRGQLGGGDTYLNGKLAHKDGTSSLSLKSDAKDVVKTDADELAVDAMVRFHNTDDAISFIQSRTGAYGGPSPETKAHAIDLLKSGAIEFKPKGRLYHVELAPTDDELLHWDKPLREQPKDVQEKVRDLLLRRTAAETAGDDKILAELFGGDKEAERAAGASSTNDIGEMTGQRVYEALVDKLGRGDKGQEAASKLLLQNGVRGIKYLDQGSRGTTGGEIIDVSKGEDGKWRAKVKVENRGGVGFTAPADIFTTSAPFDSEAAARKWAQEKTESGTHNFVIFDGADAAIKEYEQPARGKVRFDQDGSALITLMKNADASTFVHESGHVFLEEMMRDARDEKAPQVLRDDMQTVRAWLGATGDEPITTRQHEKFARGFERYLMEGTAPSKELASVFRQFKEWLVQIYKSVSALKSEITPEIRQVFDRLLAENPEHEPIIAADRERAEHFADLHTREAEDTLPEHAAQTADRMRAESDEIARLFVPDIHAELNPNADIGHEPGAEVGRNTGAGAEPASGGDATGPIAGDNGSPAASGGVGAGGGEAAAQGAGARTGTTIKTEVPAGPHQDFGPAETNLVDKAGNIRLDNLNVGEDVKDALRQAADNNDEFIAARRGVMSDAQALDLADALGMTPETLNMRKIGQAFNAEQIYAARKLLVQSATTVRDAMAKAAQGSDAEVLAYAEAKARHQMIQEQVAGITAEAGRALRAFRALGGMKEAQELGTFLEQQTGKTLFQLREEAKFGMELDTPQKVSKFINDSKRAKFSDMVMEFWINALLSGPTTHVKNIVGNMAVAVNSAVEAGIAGGIGAARELVGAGPEGRVYAGEAKARLFGILQGSKDGVIAAAKAFKNEELFTEGNTVEQRKYQAIPSAKIKIGDRELEVGGKQVRLPGRLLTAEDQYFKAIASRQELNALAYREANDLGLEGDAFRAHIAKVVTDPSDAQMEAARKNSEYQTFTGQLGPFMRNIQQAANTHWWAKGIIPFIRTPTNILKYAFERTPFGLISEEIRANLSGRNGGAAMDTQIARLTLGTTIGAAFIGLALEGLATGSGPVDPAERAMKKASGWQPNSLKIGDNYYAYDWLDPFATIANLSATFTESVQGATDQDQDIGKAAAMIFGTISKNIMGKLSLRGASDFIQAVSDPDRYGAHYLQSLAGTVVPSVVAQVASAEDPVQRQARGVLDAIRARVPGMREDLFAKRDVWGEPITSQGALGPEPGSPIRVSTETHDPVNERLIALQVWPSQMQRTIRGVELTDQQYDDLTRQAGRFAKMRLDVIVANPGFSQAPAFVQRETMTKIISDARESARSLIMMQNPTIIDAAVKAKIAPLTSNALPHKGPIKQEAVQ